MDSRAQEDVDGEEGNRTKEEIYASETVRKGIADELNTHIPIHQLEGVEKDRSSSSPLGGGDTVDKDTKGCEKMNHAQRKHLENFSVKESFLTSFPDEKEKGGDHKEDESASSLHPHSASCTLCVPLLSGGSTTAPNACSPLCIVLPTDESWSVGQVDPLLSCLSRLPKKSKISNSACTGRTRESLPSATPFDEVHIFRQSASPCHASRTSSKDSKDTGLSSHKNVTVEDHPSPLTKGSRSVGAVSPYDLRRRVEEEEEEGAGGDGPKRGREALQKASPGSERTCSTALHLEVPFMEKDDKCECKRGAMLSESEENITTPSLNEPGVKSLPVLPSAAALPFRYPRSSQEFIPSSVPKGTKRMFSGWCCCSDSDVVTRRRALPLFSSFCNAPAPPPTVAGKKMMMAKVLGSTHDPVLCLPTEMNKSVKESSRSANSLGTSSVAHCDSQEENLLALVPEEKDPFATSMNSRFPPFAAPSPFPSSKRRGGGGDGVTALEEKREKGFRSLSDVRDKKEEEDELYFEEDCQKEFSLPPCNVGSEAECRDEEDGDRIISQTHSDPWKDSGEGERVGESCVMNRLIPPPQSPSSLVETSSLSSQSASLNHFRRSNDFPSIHNHRPRSHDGVSACSENCWGEGAAKENSSVGSFLSFHHGGSRRNEKEKKKKKKKTKYCTFPIRTSVSSSNQPSDEGQPSVLASSVVLSGGIFLPYRSRYIEDARIEAGTSPPFCHCGGTYCCTPLGLSRHSDDLLFTPFSTRKYWMKTSRGSYGNYFSTRPDHHYDHLRKSIRGICFAPRVSLREGRWNTWSSGIHGYHLRRSPQNGKQGRRDHQTCAPSYRGSGRSFHPMAGISVFPPYLSSHRYPSDGGKETRVLGPICKDYFPLDSFESSWKRPNGNLRCRRGIYHRKGSAFRLGDGEESGGPVTLDIGTAPGPASSLGCPHDIPARFCLSSASSSSTSSTLFSERNFPMCFASESDWHSHHLKKDKNAPRSGEGLRHSLSSTSRNSFADPYGFSVGSKGEVRNGTEHPFISHFHLSAFEGVDPFTTFHGLGVRKYPFGGESLYFDFERNKNVDRTVLKGRDATPLLSQVFKHIKIARTLMLSSPSPSNSRCTSDEASRFSSGNIPSMILKSHTGVGKGLAKHRSKSYSCRTKISSSRSPFASIVQQPHVILIN